MSPYCFVLSFSSVPGRARDDVRGLRLPDDVPEALRLQRRVLEPPPRLLGAAVGAPLQGILGQGGAQGGENTPRDREVSVRTFPRQIETAATCVFQFHVEI